MVTIARATAPADAPVLTDLAFGARYTGYFDADRFLAQTDDLDPGLIVWPGGTLAETRADLYGFEHPDLFAPDAGRPGLSGMMAMARSEGAALSVNLPTARYADDPDAFEDALSGFMRDLLSGAFGPLPDRLILEVGAEYYATVPGTADATPAEIYGELAGRAVRVIADALTDPDLNPGQASVEIAVQAGKTMTDDVAIRDALPDGAVAEVDMIVHHRFLHGPAGVDARADLMADILDAWTADAAAEGGEGPGLFVSAMGVVGLTRTEALARWADETGGDPADVDLDARDHAGFERWWQAELSGPAYGAAQAPLILELFASYAEIGIEAASLYGTDSPHAGRLSFRDADGTDHDFIGADMTRMLKESVVGTRVHDQPAYDAEADVTAYAFESEDKLILFLAAGTQAPGRVDVEIGTDDFLGVWGDSLTAAPMSDWMDRFGIPDAPGVDETPEARTYALGHQAAETPEIGADRVTVTLDRPHEVVRLSFAKTGVGVSDIAAVSLDAGQSLILPDVPGNAAEDEPVDVPADILPDAVDDEDGGGGGAGAGLLAALLLPLLLLL